MGAIALGRRLVVRCLSAVYGFEGAVPGAVQRGGEGFRNGKLIEEAMEVRHAATADDKAGELADLYEVVCALARADKIPIAQVEQRAAGKERKTGMTVAKRQ